MIVNVYWGYFIVMPTKSLEDRYGHACECRIEKPLNDSKIVGGSRGTIGGFAPLHRLSILCRLVSSAASGVLYAAPSYLANALYTRSSLPRHVLFCPLVLHYILLICSDSYVQASLNLRLKFNYSFISILFPQF